MKTETDREQSVTDLDLIEDVLKGKRSSFSELVKRHQRGVLRLSMRFMKDLDSSQDVVQEAFIKAFDKLNTFEGRSSFKSWLYQIAVNTAKNKLRENKNYFSDIDDVHLSVGAIAEKTLVQRSVSQALRIEVDKLPFKQRTALVLRVYEDMSFNEIAEVMSCPYDTAKANYRHALLKLKEVFESQSELSQLHKDWGGDLNNFLTEMHSNSIEVD